MTLGAGIAVAAVWCCIAFLFATHRVSGCGTLILLGAALFATSMLVG